MTGPLYLSPTMPTQPSQSASKAYVDTMLSTAGVPEVPAVPAGQTWGRQTGQWVAIQAQTGFLPLTGGTMTGAINMSGNNITNLPAVPILPNGAAPAQWVLNQIAASTLYQGIWNADTNQPDLTQPSTHQNSFTWIAKTTSQTGVVISQPIPGLQGLTVFNGDTVIYSAMAGQFQLLQAGGLTVTEADARYLPLVGGTPTGPLMLSRDPVNAMEAATREWVLANTAFPEAPNDGQVYGRNGLSHTWVPSLPVSGGILTGALTLNGNASTSLNPVPLQQLTSTLGNYVPLAGNVTVTGQLLMTGAGSNLILNSNASQNLQAVPLQQLTATLGAYAPINAPTFTGVVTIPSGASIAGYAPLAAPVFTGDARAVTPTVGDNDTSIATTAFVQTALLSSSPANNNVGRNLLHNAMFNIQQRGNAGWNGNGNYTADRWRLLFSGDTNTITVPPITDAQRAAIGDEAAQYSLTNTFTGGAAAGNYSIVQQSMENVRRFSGKTVVVSFWASASAALRLGVGINLNYGTGGSAGVDVNGQSVLLTTSYARYSMTFAIPSTAGITVGTNHDDATSLRFYYSGGANYNTVSGNVGVQSGAIAVWGVQVEVAQSGQTQPTPLEKLDPVLQLQQCQRFYWAGNIPGVMMYDAVGGSYGNSSPITMAWPVPMRAIPTLTTGGAGGIAITPSFNTTVLGTLMWVSSPTLVAGQFAQLSVQSATADL